MPPAEAPPAAPPTAAPAPTTPAAPPPTPVIDTPTGIQPAVPPSGIGVRKVTGKAMEAVRERLRAAGKEPEPKPQPAKPAEKPAEPKPTPPPAKPAAEPPKTGEPPKTVEPPKPTTPPVEDKPKLGPWQLKEKWEKAAKASEKENAELRAKMSAMGDVNALREKSERLEARNKELEDAIRFADYQQSEEFKKQFEEPFVDTWTRAAKEIAELTITDGEGNSRVGTEQDLLKLANLPAGEARKMANELFGESADDVMALRRSLREAADKRQRALADAKQTGVKREQEKKENHAKLAAEVGQLWEGYQKADEAKFEFLRLKEGDDEWNEKLKSAIEFVDGAFKANAFDPALTTQQRNDIIRQHASIRGRAIAFSALRLENNRLRSQLAEKDKIIEEFKGAEPTPGEGHGTISPPGTVDRMEDVKAKIRGLAKPFVR